MSLTDARKMTPNDAPIFHPSLEEFQDPATYIDRVSSSPNVGEHGIFIIQPPASWQPPFTLDADSFRFEARKQSIVTRLKRTDSDVNVRPSKYSLNTFKKMADGLKTKYFKQRMDSISNASIESQFWKIFAEFDDDDSVRVQSAMNIRDISGFPCKAVIPEDETYVKSGWNLRNLAETSLLSYAKDGAAARNGTECNVEMCFSFAPWATEDNWAYRVSYVHFGDAVTWYATSTEDYVKMRKLLKKALKAKKNNGFGDCSKQFLLSVSDVLESEVSVTRAVQSPRQFVVTLPRAYHAHVSHGFNLLETLRVCTPGWLPVGMWFSADSCVRRIPTSISYEELVCRLLHACEFLDITTQAQVYRAARKMLSEEAKAQSHIVAGCEKLSTSNDDAVEDSGIESREIGGKTVKINEAIEGSKTVDRTRRSELQRTGNDVGDVDVKKLGISTKKEDSEISEDVTIQDAHDDIWEECESNDYSAVQELLKRCLFKVDSAAAFEIIPVNERRCAVCEAICYLSDVSCACNGTRVCLRHADVLCQCSPSNKTLRQRFTLQQLSTLIDELRRCVRQYETWNENITKALEQSAERLSLASLALLLQEAQKSGYFYSDLYQKLFETVREARECSHTAGAILDNAADHEPGTRSSEKENDDCVDTEDKDGDIRRLNFDNLLEFVTVVHRLPCIIPEAFDITLMMGAAVDINTDVEKLLSSEWTSSGPLANVVHLFNPLSSSGVPGDAHSDSDSCVQTDQDIRFIVDVIRRIQKSTVSFPKLPQLRELLDNRKWMNDVDRCLMVNPDHSQLTVDTLRKLIDKGSALTPHSPSERSLHHLRQLVAECTRLEDEAKRLRLSKHGLDAVEDLIYDARNVPVSIPSLKALKESALQAREWIARVDAILTAGQGYQRRSYLGLIEKLIAHGNALPIQLDQLDNLVALSNLARDWIGEASKAFLSKTSIYSLYEVLSPRREIYAAQIPAKHRKQRPGDAHSVHVKNVLKDVPDCDLPDAGTIANLFKNAEAAEVNHMMKLRETNACKGTGGCEGGSGETARRAAFAKSESSSPAATKYCVCAQSKTPDMIQCQLCLDYFHPSCLTNKKSVFQSKSGKQVQTDGKFLCHLCMRSRRPKLAPTVLELVKSLLTVPVRIYEGEALESLAQRALDWKDRVRDFLDEDEVINALAKLNRLSKQRYEQVSRDKADRIIQSELLKAGNVGVRQQDYSGVSSYGKQPSGDQLYKHQVHHGYPPPLRHSHPYQQNSYASVTPGQMSFNISSSSVHYASHGYDSAGVGNKYPNQEHFGGARGNVDSNYASAPVEHAYSTMSKHVAINQPQAGQRSHAPPPPPPAPVLELSEKMRNELERLMLEGDLLEVSMDETQQLWTIRKACQPGNAESLYQLTGISEPSPIESNVNASAAATSSSATATGKLKQRQKRKQEMEQREELAWSDAENEKKLPKQRKQKEVKKKSLKKEAAEVKTKVVEMKKRKHKTKVVGGAVARVEKKQKYAKAAAAVAAADSSSSSGNDEDCSAEPCKKPLGKALDWVMCDRCKLWYHNICIDVKPQDVADDTDFICRRCAH